jgi:uncharacterized protein YhfF
MTIDIDRLNSFTFGDSADLSEHLLDLVRDGHKTATCAALRDYADSGLALPEVGRLDVALTWEGKPALIIETTEVTTRRFCVVDAAFALAEGEEDSHAGWVAGHRAYFERNGGWDAEMMLVCERFRLVQDLEAADPA